MEWATEDGPAAAFVVDAGGRCLAANAAAAALLGYESHELVRLPAGALSASRHEGSLHRIEITLRLRRSGRTTLLRSDGSVVHVDFVAAPTTVDGEQAIVALCWPRARVAAG